MIVYWLIVISEALVFGGLLSCLVMGRADGLLEGLMPRVAAQVVFGIPALAGVVCAGVSCRFGDRKASSYVNASGIAVLALLAVHASATHAEALQVPGLYYAVVLGIAVIAESPLWIAAFAVLTLGEVAAMAFQLISTGTGVAAALDELWTRSAPALPSVSTLLVAGLVPWALTRHRWAFSRSPAAETADTSREPFPVPPPDSDPLPTKTQVFTADYVADLRQNSGKDQVDDLLASVVYFMSRNFRAYSALGFIYDPVRQVFSLNSFQSKSMQVAKSVAIPAGSGIVGRIATEKRSFMSGDLSLYGSEIHYYSGIETVNSILAVPIISHNNELLGTLVLDSKDKNAFRDADKEILKRFSSLAAALITNARMMLFQERAARTFQIFYQASHLFTTAISLDEVFDVLFQTVPMVVPCSRLMAITFNEESHTGVVRKVAGQSPDIAEGFEFPINAGLYSFAFQKRKIVTITDFQQYDPARYYRFIPDEARNASIRSLIVFPITDDESRCLGLFSAESTEADQFTGEAEQVMATLVDNAEVAFTRALLYQRMERLATTDGLTELNNHRHFQELLAREVERSRRYNRPLSLLLMDIDHFKSFNDTYGHPVGDLVLKEIAACIRRAIRINDIPARYGGEEFTVIIPETPEQGAMVIAERIRTTIEQHVIHSLERELHVTVSIGCASFPGKTDSQQELIDAADKALYYSKEHGRNQVTLFNASMRGKG